MGWFDSYDASYYDRGFGGGRAGWTGTRYGGTPYGGAGYGNAGYGAGGYGYQGGTHLGYGSYDYGRAGYDRTFRRPPEESPTYGRGGDQALRRWARSHGYDLEYEIQPDRTSGGTYGGMQPGYRVGGGYGRDFRGGYGAGRSMTGYDTYGGTGFRGGSARGRNDWGYRW